MTRRVFEKLWTKKVCVDFLAPKLGPCNSGFVSGTVRRPWLAGIAGIGGMSRNS